MTERLRFHRPVKLSSEALDTFAREDLDPAVVHQISHETAKALVEAGRSKRHPAVVARLVGLVDELGVATIADLWATQPARSLPGALWRLYALQEWINRSPVEAAREYQDGLQFADVAGVVAGVGSPPGPNELKTMINEILRGVFAGDMAVALHRAGAFARVVASGRASYVPENTDPEESRSEAARAARMLTMGEDLDACARMWQKGSLL